ncbi:MAG: MFS transporter [Chloroflexi bacterium]|nr:MFS transporter [Chloroflexota bacterium]
MLHLARHRARRGHRSARERERARRRTPGGVPPVARRHGDDDDDDRAVRAGRPALAVALTTAASLFGDTLLYTALPVNAARLGLDGLAVGLILSLNRWVRLVTNSVAAQLYERLPAGLLVVAALALAVVTSAVYALPSLLLLFFGARLLWGFCWSLLRHGSYLAAIDDTPQHCGRHLGEMRAVFGIGYLAGAAYAPFAVEAFGWPVACLGAALLTLVGGAGPALIAAPWRRAIRSVAPDAERLSVWSAELVALFLIGALQLSLSAGFVIVAGGFRIAGLFPGGAPVLGALVPASFIAGVFVLSQRVAQIGWSTFAGRIAERAAGRTFLVAAVVAVFGSVTLASATEASLFVGAGAIVFAATVTAIIAVEVVIARRAPAHDRARILAAYNTWADLGAACGALAGGALQVVGPEAALWICAFLMSLTVPLWLFAARVGRWNAMVGS